jgi:hypothetical protein
MLNLKTVRGHDGKWVILPEGVERLMLVPDEMRKCVAFLYYRKNGKILPAGTAFFVGYPLPDDPDRAVTLLLTAHHVIAGIQAQSDDDQVLLRLNTKDGGATWAESHAGSWYQHDSSVDCAILPWSPPTELNVDYRAWHLWSWVTGDPMRQEGIGIGDEVFIIGLFRNHLGRDRNEPILRVGNIAAMPADPIRTRLYGDMRAILVEARSIGGLSGSPVFAHLGFARLRDGHYMQWQATDGTVGPFVFLGLMHGHWDALETEVDVLAGQEKINMGVGIVVPAEQIIRDLRTVIEESAMALKKRQDQENTPTEDAAPHEQSEFERFEDVARKLVNTPKSEIDEKRKEHEGQ